MTPPPRPAHGEARRSARLEQRVLSLADFEAAARRRLPRSIFGYVQGGVEDNLTREANREAFVRRRLMPGTMKDVSGRSTAIELFGRTHGVPFGIAPMGGAALAWRGGDLALAAAADAFGAPFILTASSTVRLEEVARVAPGAWFEIHTLSDRDRLAAMADRLERAGIEVLVVMADVPVLGNRENNQRIGFTMPPKPSLRLMLDGLGHPRWVLGTAAATLVRDGMPHFENADHGIRAPMIARSQPPMVRDRPSLEDLAFLRRRWKGRLVVKGVLDPADAARARDAGVDGLIVSNHGGRQLDGAVASLDALEEMAASVSGLTLMLDGGVRRGTDVLKALACGARFVFLGRPFMFALAAAGGAGVRHAFSILKAETARDMAMMGINRPEEMAARHIRAAP